MKCKYLNLVQNNKSWITLPLMFSPKMQVLMYWCATKYAIVYPINWQFMFEVQCVTGICSKFSPSKFPPKICRFWNPGPNNLPLNAPPPENVVEDFNFFSLHVPLNVFAPQHLHATKYAIIPNLLGPKRRSCPPQFIWTKTQALFLYQNVGHLVGYLNALLNYL